jgi:hypothetical protein
MPAAQVQKSADKAVAPVSVVIRGARLIDTSPVTRFSKRRHSFSREVPKSSLFQLSAAASQAGVSKKHRHSVSYVTVLFQRLARQWVKNRIRQVEIPPCTILGDRCCVPSEPLSR